MALANGARSRGVRLEMMFPSTTTGSSTQRAPAFSRSSLMPREPVARLPRRIFGRDGNPAAVADEGDELALLEELTGQRQHLRVATQLVWHEAAGISSPQKSWLRASVRSRSLYGRVTSACRRRCAARERPTG